MASWHLVGAQYIGSEWMNNSEVISDCGMLMKTEIIEQDRINGLGLEKTLTLFCDPLNGQNLSLTFKIDITFDGALASCFWGLLPLEYGSNTLQKISVKDFSKLCFWIRPMLS